MECRAGLVLAAMLTVLSVPHTVWARRRVIIEVPVHIRSHQHTHTVYRSLPVAHAPAPAPAPAPVPAPAAFGYAPRVQPATLVSHQPAAQRVAHHAAPGGLTSITLVNLGRGGHTPSQADEGEGEAEEVPQQPQRRLPRQHHPQHQQPPYQDNNQRHHISGINFQRTEHTAEVYR